MNQDDDIRRGHAMVDEGELLDLFAPRRPDAAAFARGVHERLRARSEGGGRSGGNDASPRARAAARLPLDLGALGASKWATLAPPTLLIGLVAGVFLASMRWLRTTVTRAPVRTARVPIGFSSGVEQVTSLVLGAVLLPCLLLLPVGTALGEAFLLVALAAMVMLVVTVRRTATTHGLDRAMVATVGLGCLQSVFVTGLFWLLLDGPLAGSAQWQSATTLVLVFGMLLLSPAAPRSAFTVVLSLGIVGWAWMHDPGTRVPNLDSLAAYAVQAPAPAPGDAFLTADYAAKIVVELRANGRDVPLSPAVDAALATERARQPGNTLALSVEARLHRIDDEEWRRLALRPEHAARLDALLRTERPLQPPRSDDYLLAMLLAARELDDAARDRLADRLIAGLVDATFPLEAHATAARWLDALGRGRRMDERRAAIHELLVKHQHHGPFDPGGFAPRLDIAHSNHQANDAALGLMERFGVPDALDLPLLHRHLSRTGRLFTRVPLAESGYQLTTYVDRLRLERLVGVPQRSPLRTLYEEHVFVAISLLVLLCLYATWMAPRRDALPGGAMP